MKKLNVLVPSINRDTQPSFCSCLRDNGERKVCIIGVDMGAEGCGRHIADSFYQVPPRNDPSYIDTILEICKKESADVYYALGEEEAIGAARHLESFKAIGVGVITPGTPEMLAIATDKCRWHEYFMQQGVPHADFRIIDRYDQIEIAARELGYPGKDVFFKPAFSKGGRGAIIVTSRDLSREYYQSRASEVHLPLECFLHMLSPLRNGGFRPLLAMEYLPGTYYSVDVLSWEGKVLHIVPKVRMAGSASNTTVGYVDLNEDAMEMAGKACKAFRFSYLQNYEMKLDAEGRPRIYDINPRGGASMTLCKAAGDNIAYYAVKMAAGEEIPKPSLRNGTKMMRYYDAFFE